MAFFDRKDPWRMTVKVIQKETTSAAGYCIALHCIVLYCIVLHYIVLICAFISIFSNQIKAPQD